MPTPLAPTPASPIHWKAVVIGVACAALSACAGGGSPVQSVSAIPTPPPPPPAPPPPSPSKADFDTAEFRRSDGPSFHGADTAWSAGATGDGEIIAVIDTGLDSDSPEFSGRLHSMSRDIAGNRGLDPEDDHGSNVARIAAGARNDSGVMGIAFDAQILALRADLPGSCGAGGAQDGGMGCVLMDGAIANGVDSAIATGATVINLSVGGSDAAPELRSAIARAADAGIVVVVSAGNGGDGGQTGVDPNQPNPFASSLLEAGNGNVIIVGSVDENGDFSAFSNRAGDNAASFISARGERICCTYQDGHMFVETVDGQEFVTLFSGTSFAAPQVAGAVALLAQAFPNLTGQEITEIILDTASDAGTSGIDRVFGTGILDIAAAFEPQGTTKLAGTQKALALGDVFAAGSPAMGDALADALLTTIVTDRYDRAYSAQLGEHATIAAMMPRLRSAIEQRGISRSGRGDGFALAVTIGEGPRAAGLSWANALQLTPDDAAGATVLAARIAARIAPDTQIGFAMAQSASGLSAQLQGADRPAFLIAGDATDDIGFAGQSAHAFAMRHQWGRWGLSISGERGRVLIGSDPWSSNAVLGAQNRPSTTKLSLAADSRWSGFDANLAVSWLSEESTMLGSRFNPVFGLDGAQSLFVDAQASHRIKGKWRVGASFRTGFTAPRGGTLIAAGSRVRTQGWSFDVTRRGTFVKADSLGLRVSQPLRVSGGGLNFDLPVAYDYASESAILGHQTLALTPNGREIMGELNWSAPTDIGTVSASAFYRREPGHIQSAPDDAGAMISVLSRF